ncbi:MAG: sugar phosphate isomerase/epimerase [Clostridia bacterium]|nr:sugar phosphate isomerase/epimerase [Clostridia bacterium]
MKLGVQIYGSTPEFRADPEGFCARLAAVGYTQIEPVVSLNMSAEQIAAVGMNPVWQPEETPEFKKLLEKHGLELTSCHIFGDPAKDADKAAKLAEENDLKQIVVNCPRCENEADYAAFADGCLVLAEKLREVGVELWIHNSWPEIRAKVNGKTALEYILERCGGKVGTQIDVGWVLYGGEDPVMYLEKVLPYLRCIHYKDILAGYADMDIMKIHIALGRGAVDWRAVQAFAKAHNLPEIIDQDMSPGDFLKDLEETAALLKNA